MKPIYVPNFVDNPDAVFKRLLNELEWKKYGNKPRKEYYCNDHDVPYSYGNPAFADTYARSPYTDDILNVRAKLEDYLTSIFDVCFLNLYEDFSDHIGWHADDSPEMDPDKPIVTVSLGAAREIWFKARPSENSSKEVTKILLGHGSICIMPAGMQATDLHRIVKHDRPCGERVSMTYRHYKFI